jgi:peptide/nickel transport system ATP-binding protein
MLSVQGLTTVLETESGLARAVDALSLTIDRRETFALVGESGSGKSMTALSLLRLLPDNGRIASGSVVLGGTDFACCANSTCNGCAVRASASSSRSRRRA